MEGARYFIWVKSSALSCFFLLACHFWDLCITNYPFWVITIFSMIFFNSPAGTPLALAIQIVVSSLNCLPLLLFATTILFSWSLMWWISFSQLSISVIEFTFYKSCLMLLQDVLAQSQISFWSTLIDKQESRNFLLLNFLDVEWCFWTDWIYKETTFPFKWLVYSWPFGISSFFLMEPDLYFVA